MALEVREEDHKQSKVTWFLPTRNSGSVLDWKMDGNGWNLIWNEKVFSKSACFFFQVQKKTKFEIRSFFLE